MKPEHLKIFQELIKTKKCTRCGEIKSLDEFYKDKGSSNGRSSRCKKCSGEVAHRWRIIHSAKCREKDSQWRKVNLEKVRKIGKKAMAKSRSTPEGRLNNNIACAIRQALHGNKSGQHWEFLINFTLNQLKHHLEKQFQPGMTWENYGKWHIDHHIPISAFNYGAPEDIDFKRCWCLKNLRPMWAAENQKKYNKLDAPFQPSLRIASKKE